MSCIQVFKKCWSNCVCPCALIFLVIIVIIGCITGVTFLLGFVFDRVIKFPINHDFNNPGVMFASGAIYLGILAIVLTIIFGIVSCCKDEWNRARRQVERENLGNIENV